MASERQAVCRVGVTPARARLPWCPEVSTTATFASYRRRPQGAKGNSWAGATAEVSDDLKGSEAVPGAEAAAEVSDKLVFISCYRRPVVGTPGGRHSALEVPEGQNIAEKGCKIFPR